MDRKIVALLVLISFSSPAFGEEPTNAIEWLRAEENLMKDEKVINSKITKKTAKDIAKTTLLPNNLNSIGIISSKITGIDTYLWEDIDEYFLFTHLTKLPNLNFHSAQTFLKRILISETHPPANSPDSEYSGKLYFLSKLDKLIKMGALDEAETTILQVLNIDPEIFNRWVKVSFLTGRITKLCETLEKNSGLSRDLTLRIICLKHLNDWDAAALILSTSSSLNLLSKKRETLLIHHLDPSLITIDKLYKSFNNFDEFDYYLSGFNPQIKPNFSKEAKYLYPILKVVILI